MASTPVPPSLPVRKSVLNQLGIADNELPHGLARLKHNLLLPPHTSSQGSNTCTNSNLRGRVTTYPGGEKYKDSKPLPVWGRLKDTLAESPDPENTFKSLSYLDQIALVCLAAGCRDCRAPDCLQYRSKLERVVPVCPSWPGLRDWILCITSCVLRIKDGEMNFQWLFPKPEENWYLICFDLRIEDLCPRFRNHITACIFLTHRYDDWGMTERASEIDDLAGTDESGLIGRPASWCDVGLRRCLFYL